MDVLLGVLFKSNQKQCHFLKARRVWKDNPGICVCVCVCTHKYMCMLTYFYTYVLRACSLLVWSWIWVEWGFPGGASGKEPACQCGRYLRHRFDPWVRKITWRRAWQPAQVFLPGESHGQRSLEGYSPWGLKVKDRTEAEVYSLELEAGEL